MRTLRWPLRAVLAFVCLFGALDASAQAPSGYTTVSATLLRDATGALVTNATIRFQPVNSQGVPLSFRAGGSGGQTIAYPVSTTVASGSFSIVLADTTLTSPVNVCYAATLISNLTGRAIPFPGYSCIQPSGSTWNFDSYTPNLGPLVVEQAGIAGANANLVPDPNFVNGFADWSNAPGGWTIAYGTPYASLNSVVAPISLSGNYGYVGSATFYLVDGQTYVFSGYINATGVSSGNPAWWLFDPTTTTGYSEMGTSVASGHAQQVVYTFTFAAAGHSAGDLVAVHLIFDTGGSTFTSLSAANPSIELAVQGLAATPCSVTIGTVTALGSGATPTVTNSGSACAAVFNFGIPISSSGGSSGSSGSTFAFSVDGSVIAAAANGLSINGTSLSTTATTILINGATL